MKTSRGQPWYLVVLAAFAEDEATRIQNLAIAGHWTTSPRQPLKQALIENLKCFPGLKKLKIYHSDVSWKDFVSITEEDDEVGNRRTLALVRRSEDEVREEVMRTLDAGKEKDEEWTSQLPKIEVSRDLQWCWRDGETKLEYCGLKLE